jgi:hypothetical protein
VHRRYDSRHAAARQHGASTDWFNPSIAHPGLTCGYVRFAVGPRATNVPLARHTVFAGPSDDDAQRISWVSASLPFPLPADREQ